MKSKTDNKQGPHSVTGLAECRTTAEPDAPPKRMLQVSRYSGSSQTCIIQVGIAGAGNTQSRLVHLQDACSLQADSAGGVFITYMIRKRGVLDQDLQPLGDSV